MWPYFPELLAVPVPRYTSYPTAAEFGEGMNAGHFTRALQQVQGDISLYVHIPFCEKICWYCGCNTAAANHKKRLASYLDALHRDIALTAALLPPGIAVRRIAFGGGSPNAIAPHDFVRLMDALVLNFPMAEPVVSVELDPRTLTHSWRDVIAGVGATHASLGVQTFAPHLQTAIGREQPEADIRRSVTLLRDAGISSLNFDLMYGLPGQTMNDLEQSLRLSAGLGADRIALFGYAHVPQLIPRQRKIDADALPDQEERFRMAALGYRLLSGEGYQPVGFDHFALPGDPLAQAALSGHLHRNFQGFTDDGAPVLIGLGASSICIFPDLLVQKEKNAGRYRMLLSQDRHPVERGIARSRDDRTRGAIIESLLCTGQARVGAAMLQEALPRLAPFASRGLLRMADDVVIITGAGLPYARSIAAQFDVYRKDSLRRFSSAV